MIESTNLKELRCAEYSGGLSNLCNKLEEMKVADERVRGMVKLLREKLTALELAMRSRRESELTPELKAAERLRVGAYCALIGQVKSLKRMPIEDIAKAAEVVYQAMASLGKYPYRRSFQEESGMIRVMVERLEQMHAEEVKLLGLQQGVECLKQTSAEVERILNERMTVKEERQKFLPGDARREVQQVFQRLCLLINAGIIWSGEEKYLEVTRLINEYVREMHWTLNVRKGKRRARKEKEERSEGDVESNEVAVENTGGAVERIEDSVESNRVAEKGREKTAESMEGEEESGEEGADRTPK